MLNIYHKTEKQISAYWIPHPSYTTLTAHQDLYIIFKEQNRTFVHPHTETMAPNDPTIPQTQAQQQQEVQTSSVDPNDPKNKPIYDPLTGMIYDPVTKKLYAPKTENQDSKEAQDSDGDDGDAAKEKKKPEKEKLTLKQKVKKLTLQGVNAVAQPGSTNWV